MQEIKNRLEAREAYLKKLKKEKERALRKVPEGALRISCHNDRVQYYHRKNPQDAQGVYIRDDDKKLAEALAQKDYNQKIVKVADQEIKVIEKFLEQYPSINCEQLYSNLHKERQNLVLPIKESDEDFIKRWQEAEYVKKGFSPYIPEFYTAKGERVRSKSEVIIADLLNRKGIPYRYEYPLYLEGRGIIHPDFTVLDIKRRREVYLEHLGRMDDPEYVEENLGRIAVYQYNGYHIGEDLILTFETKESPLNQKLLEEIIDYYFV